MTHLLRLSYCLLIATSLAACNKSEAPAPAASDTSATAATPATPVETATPPATGAAQLSMDKVKTYVQALKNLAAAEKADPNLDSAQNISVEDTAQYTARLQGDATMRAAIEEAGLSTGEFVAIGDALMEAMLAQGAVASGQSSALPDGVDPAAVEFVKQHEAEIQALMGESEAG